MTYEITVYSKSGKKVSSEKLDADLYADDVINHDLIHEYLLLQQSNRRVAIAHTKTRGEIRGSGKKLFGQKGTGNARAGDKKSPIRKGGGVVFGPRSERNFSKKMPQKMRRRAMRGILVMKAKQDGLVGVKDLTFDVPKTKDALALLEAVGCAQKRVLVAYAGDHADVVRKSFSNLDRVRYVSFDYLNPEDVMWSEVVVFSDVAVDRINALV